MFWLETLSLVDFLTIPEPFVSVVLQQNWLGNIFLKKLYDLASHNISARNY